MFVHYATKGNDIGDLELLVAAFKNGRRKFESEKKLLFRTYKDGSLRATMSDSYSIVENDWYLEQLKRFIPGGRLSHFDFSDADNFAGNVLIPDTIRSEADSDYGGILNCGNSAIGQRSVWQTPGIFRFICMNGCVWGAKNGIELRRRHRGIDIKEFAEAMRVNMRDMAVGAPVVNVFAFIAKSLNLSGKALNIIAETFMKDTPREKNAFGINDALTRAAQKLSLSEWETLNDYSGALLNGGSTGWETLNAKAKLMTEAEVTKAFGRENEPSA